MRLVTVYREENVNFIYYEGEWPRWKREEISRRCFWATWLANCINADQYTPITIAKEKVRHVVLPRDDVALEGDIEPAAITLADEDKQNEKAKAVNNTHPSIMAEIVKLIMIW